MEDAHCAHLKDKASFVGVFDGHGGSSVAQWLSKNLYGKILAQYTPSFWDIFFKGKKVTNYDIPQITNEHISKTFLAIDKSFNTSTGSTAICAFIDKEGKTLTIANVGDSRAVLATKDSYKDLSTDHKCSNNFSELSRLQKMGAEFGGGRNGHAYVFSKKTKSWIPPFKEKQGALAVTRAFGDTNYKEFGVTAEPEIQNHAIEQDDQFVILACDGIWDIMDSREVVDLVRQKLNEGKNEQEAAAALIEEASIQSTKMFSDEYSGIESLANINPSEFMRKVKRLAHDNQTVAIVRLNK